MNAKEFLSKLADLSGDQKEEKIIAKHKMTKEQISLWVKLKELDKQLKSVTEQKKIARKRFWNKAESDLDIFDKDLEVDEETLTILVKE